MSYSSRRKRRDDRLGQALVAGVVIVVAGVLFFAFWLKANQVAINPDTLCPYDGPRSVTLVLLDTTDALTPVQKEDVIKRLDDIKDNIPDFGEIELFKVSTEGDRLLQSKLNLCNPGRGSEVSELTGNPRLRERRWEKRFSQRTEIELNDLLKPDASEISPIMESIQQAAVQAFSGSKLANASKKLIVVSDLLQNTSELSQYRTIEPFDEFKQTSYYLKVRPNLAGVDVTVLLLNRTQNGIGRRAQLIKFWEQYFDDAQVENFHIIPIEG